VSEYQYYEFRAIDRPLDERDMAATEKPGGARPRARSA
jgi:hypothetical protein